MIVHLLWWSINGLIWPGLQHAEFKKYPIVVKRAATDAGIVLLRAGVIVFLTLLTYEFQMCCNWYAYNLLVYPTRALRSLIQRSIIQWNYHTLTGELFDLSTLTILIVSFLELQGTDRWDSWWPTECCLHFIFRTFTVTCTLFLNTREKCRPEIRSSVIVDVSINSNANSA